MARRMTKGQFSALITLLLVSIPLAVIVKLLEAIGWVMSLVGVAVAVGLFIWYQHDKKEKRLSYLRTKYENEEIVQKIIQGCFWQGQSEDQLRDSLGEPADIDYKMLKNKTRNVWKYHHQGSNRFGLRIILENGYVTGWDKKN